MTQEAIEELIQLKKEREKQKLESILEKRTKRQASWKRQLRKFPWKTNHDFLSWVLLQLYALCVLPNRDSKTWTMKTEEKNPLYINTYSLTAPDYTHVTYIVFTADLTWSLHP